MFKMGIDNINLKELVVIIKCVNTLKVLRTIPGM